MQLIYVCQDGASASGVATYGYSLLRHDAGARMLLLNASGVPGWVPRELASRVATVPEERSHRTDVVARALGEMVADATGPSIVLPNTGDTPWASTARLLAEVERQRRQPLRVVGVIHSDTDTQYALERHYRSIAPVWVGVSRRCADRLRDQGCASVHELPYPIDVPELPAVRAAGTLKVAYVGRLEEPQKRVSRLVPTFLGLGRLGVDFTATIAGDGPAAGEIRQELCRCPADLRARIAVLGAIEPRRVRELWRTHDVCVLVSAYEGLPLALLEAMSEGVCPVVMAVASGLSDVLVDGENARVVPQGDVSALTEALADLASRPGELRRLGEGARRTVALRHAPGPHFARLRHCCELALQRPAPAVGALEADPTAAAVRRLVSRAAALGRPVAVFGAGMFGRKVVDACVDARLPLAALFDSDATRAGRTYAGLPCRGPAELRAFPDAAFLVGSLQFTSEIADIIDREFAAAGLPAPPIVASGPS